MPLKYLHLFNGYFNFYNDCIKMLCDKIIPKVRLERAQWVRTLPEDQSLVSSTDTSGLQLSITLVPRDLKPSSGFHGHCIHVMHIYSCTHII